MCRIENAASKVGRVQKYLLVLKSIKKIAFLCNLFHFQLEIQYV